MLEKLYIKNYLIIKEAELNFTGGLNIITGETGAGKSIILDALGLLLGDRGNYSIIKNEDQKLVVEGLFNFNGYKKGGRFLKENSLNAENGSGYAIVRRELSKKGISRTFINDTPVNTGLLKEFGDIIIDIHSQNEHQSLLRKETHLDFLDSFNGDSGTAEEYRNKFGEYKKLVSDYESLKSKKDSLMERKSFIDFQLREINNINPLPGEDAELEQSLKKLENSEQINEAVSNAQGLLYEKDENVNAGILAAIKELRKITAYDKTIEKNLSVLEEAYAQIKSVTEELRNFSGTIDYDGDTTEQIRQRLSALTFLKKKYNLTVNGLIKKAEELAGELNLTENFDYETEKLEKEITESIKNLYGLAEKLTQKRKAAAVNLEKSVNKYLQETGLEGASFKVKIEDYAGTENTGYAYTGKNIQTRLTATGKDDTEFFVKINKGDDFTSLRKTASGGEISRIMLSLKASISGRESIPILVFDEIDAGISGKTADKVGKLMSRLAGNHQIIAITHLPQIAAASDNHLKVSKKETAKDTQAAIERLGEEERVTEVAKLFSGKTTTEASLKTARELIEQYEKK